MATRSTDSAIHELRDGMNRLRGRLFEAIEATGVATDHQRAMKGLIRGLSYDLQADIEACLRRSRGPQEDSDGH